MRDRAERAAAYSGGNGHYNKREIVLAVKDVKSWIHGLCQTCAATVLFGKFFYVFSWTLTDLTAH